MIEYLEKLDNKKLAEFWCYFNKWQYPPELDRFKPNNWNLLPTQIKQQINTPIMDYINSRVSKKELLREWNKERMPGIEFDIWWENRKPMSDLGRALLEAIYKLENSNLN